LLKHSYNKVAKHSMADTKDKSKDYTEDYLNAYWQELPKNSK
jgi:hypothetical protein